MSDSTWRTVADVWLMGVGAIAMCVIAAPYLDRWGQELAAWLARKTRRRP